MSKNDVQSIKIADIKRDGGTQAREVTSQRAIAEYSEAIKNGDKFPPVHVFYDGETYWLADGFHRIEAALLAAREEIEAKIREGTIHEARWFALGANKDHGERLTNADKRHGVLMVLRDDELSRLSDREIAAQCKVSHPFVAGLRKEMKSSSNDYQPDQSSPKKSAKDAELERLKKDIADREAFAKKQEEETHQRIAEEKMRVEAEAAEQIKIAKEEADQRVAEEKERAEAEIVKKIAEMEEKHRSEVETLRETNTEESSNDLENERLRKELEEKEKEAQRLQEELEAALNVSQEQGDTQDIENRIKETQEKAEREAEQRIAEERERAEAETARKIAELEEKYRSETEALRDAYAGEPESDLENERLRKELEEKEKEAQRLQEELEMALNASQEPAESKDNAPNETYDPAAIEKLKERSERQSQIIKRLLYDKLECKMQNPYQCPKCVNLEKCIKKLDYQKSQKSKH